LDVKGICGINFDTALSNIEFVSFDIETTGLSPALAKIVELSGIRFRLDDDAVSIFSTLINPGCLIPPQVTAIHGITNEMVADAPCASEVIPGFFRWIGDPDIVLVAHNASFDLGFLKFAIAKEQLPVPMNHVIDTLSLSRRLVEDVPNYKLSTLTSELALGGGGYHRALSDSHHVRNLLTHLIKSNSLKRWQDVAELKCLQNFGVVHDVSDSMSSPPHLAGFIEAIRQAIQGNLSVSFKYKGVHSSKRRVSPTALIEDKGVFYLTGNCHRMLEQRTFRVDRMHDLAVV
jgi:DNA polymerase III epsilon subunit family exonuclease